MRQKEKEGRRNGFSFSAADQDHAGSDAECREARGLDVDRTARGAYHVRTEWCPDDGEIPGTGISYTSLSKPSQAPEAGSRETSWPHLSKCPYCGHGMRKRWDRCPACHQVLEQPLPEDAVRCRGCGRVYEGNMLRFCPACGCRLLDTPVEILPELTAEERAQYAAGHCEVCPHCRGPVPDVAGLKYCPHCGFEVSTKKNRQAFWGSSSIVSLW